MNKKSNKFSWTRIIDGIGRGQVILTTIAIILVVVVVGLIIGAVRRSSVGVEVDESIDVTPTQVESMKKIGEWEFLSISDEELIDTVRRGFFSDDELVRIYYGTLRLGINMHKTQPHFIKKDKDTLTVELPPVELLDENFIDEARTQSFYESGKWDAKSFEEMYQRAAAKMKARCLTPENINSAEQNALRQFYQLMRSMGYKNVKIRFETPAKDNPKAKS